MRLRQWSGRWSVRSVSLGLVAVAASAGRAEQVQLPYQVQADGGAQWLIYNGGQLQMQGNSPTFSQAGMINIDGRQPSSNNQFANIDEKTKEIVVNLSARNGASVKCTRRIKIDDGGVARVIDVFENTQDREVTTRIQLVTNVNFGINNATVMDDPRGKKTQIAWIADVSNGRGAMSLFAGKGSKIAPTIQYNQGNNQVSAQITLKVPAKDKVAIVHWHGGFDNSDEATKWVEQARESRLLADVPVELRKAIVNIAGTAGGLGSFELLRGDNGDVVELRGGDQLRGKVLIKSYALQTAFGLVEVPAEKVLGVMSVGDFKPRQVLITTAGEILGGTLKDSSVPIGLSGGKTTQVPLNQVNRIGFSAPANAEPPEFEFKQPMLVLRSGERCLIDLPAEPIEFVTRLGDLKLPPDKVATIVLKTQSGSQEVYLADGSRLVGVLPQQTWKFKLPTAVNAGEVEFPTASIARVQLIKLGDEGGGDSPTLSLVGGDVIATRLAGKLQLTTSFDTLEIDAAELRSITRPDESAPDVQITTADGTSLRGTLAGAEGHGLAATVGGLNLNVPIASVVEYNNTRPFPGATLVQQARDVIKQLDADEWKTREAAEAKLVAMGAVVLPVLEESQASQSPEAQQRLTAIIARMKKEAPSSASKLPTQPPME